MNETEWVVVYWPGNAQTQRVEKRFRGSEREQAYNYAMRLPDKFKVYIDHVNQGEGVRVR